MITINTDKGLVKLENWDDILTRPKFNQELDPKESKLETIIGSYFFGEKIKCGLSSCHTPHSKGYLVATKDGCETNIGKDCGKKYFGVDFETLSKKFDRDVVESESRETLWEFRNHLNELELTISNLRQGKFGADEIYKKLRFLMRVNGSYPAPVYKVLSRMRKNRNGDILVSRKASSKEIEDAKVIENRSIERPYYIDEVKAVLDGIEVLYEENDLRRILVLDLEANIARFKELDIDGLDYKDLRHWVNWKGSVKSKIEKSEVVVRRGRQLFEKNNLKKLLYIPMTPEEKEQFYVAISKSVL